MSALSTFACVLDCTGLHIRGAFFWEDVFLGPTQAGEWQTSHGGLTVLDISLGLFSV